MNKILKNLKSKESYLKRKSEQLHQWERVIKILSIRSNKSEANNKSEIRVHIGNILVQKARSEYKLKQLQQASNEEWNSTKTGLEKSWIELRAAFLIASARATKY
jgi:hypothetical protein